MAESFDPYYQWLGIPPAEQPAHHYRLLGVQLFESNDEVISNAADRQMVHVRTFQTGPRAALSQQILNEISAARVCLLNPGKNAAYDQELRSSLAAEPAVSRAQQPASKQDASADVLSSLGAPLVKPAGGFSAESYARRERSKNRFWLGIVAMLVLVIVLVGIVYVTFSGNFQLARQNTDKPTPGQQKTQSANPPAAEEKTAPDEAPDPEPIPPTKKAKDPQPEQPTVQPPEKTTADPPAENTSNQPDPETKPAPPPPKPDTTPPDNPEPGKRPIPSEKAQQEVAVQIKDLYQDKYAAAKTGEQKVELAEFLLTQADELKEDYEARFVLLREARDLAAAGGNRALGQRAVKRIVEAYTVDELEWQAQLLLDMAPSAEAAEEKRSHIVEMLELTEKAIQQQQPDVAGKLIGMAQKLLRRSGDAELRKRALTLNNQVKNLRRLQERVKKARNTLAENANDPKANLFLGKYLCFSEEDWEHGLPLLAKCGNRKLQAAARGDLKNPTAVDEQVKTGDVWYTLAQDEQALAGFFDRAGYWYTQALSKTTGLTKAKLENRLREIESNENTLQTSNDPANTSHGKGKRPSRRKSKAEPGLIGRVIIRNQVNARGIDAGLILKYQPGKQFLHTTWWNLAAQYGVRSNWIQIELAGLLHLTKTTKITVRQKGGSASRGVLWLYVDGRELGAVGDDRTKDTTYTISLNKGDHTVRWLLRGGYLGNNLISFHDASTQQPLAIYYTPQMLGAARSIPTKAEVDVSTE